MEEWQNGGIPERRKIPPNPKRWNDGKSPKILKDGSMTMKPCVLRKNGGQLIKI